MGHCQTIAHRYINTFSSFDGLTDGSDIKTMRYTEVSVTGIGGIAF